MSNLTEHQIEVMKHTVSDPGRNWFGTSYNNEDSDAFEELVKEGYATKHEPASWMGDEVIYRLTQKGKDALSEKEKA